MQFIEYIKNLFKPPSPEALALKELEQAKRALLEAQTGVEFAQAHVRYNTERVKRLSAYLHEATKQCESSKS